MPNPPNAKMPAKTTKAKKSKRISTNPPESQIVYNGPLVLSRGPEERHTTTVWMTYGPSTLVSSGSGVINSVFSNDPSGYNDWSSFAAVWDEYRVLGMTVHYAPYNRYNQSLSIIVGPVFLFIDRDDGTVQTTEALALNYESVKMKNLADPWKITAKMAGVAEATFITTATPVANLWIKSYASGLTNSITYGKTYISALVQFRGRN